MAIESAIDTQELVRETPTDFRVSRRVYTDPQVFQLELERIFHRTWVYVGHESEIPDGGDYKTTFIGRHPVILARSSDDLPVRQAGGTVNVFFNRCRHRGATVCQQEYGNANYFRCAYHGWVYNNKGDLMGVPFPEGYGDDFDQGKLGLVKVPRVGSYRGFIFASLSAEGPSLDEHLGNAREYIDIFAGQGPEGIDLKAGAHKFFYDGNWKLQMENTIDRYHASFLHASAFEIAERRTGRPVRAGFNPDKMHVWDLGNGHSACELVPGGLHAGDQVAVTMRGPGFNVNIFPNLALLFNQVRHILPHSGKRTEVFLYLTRLRGAPPETNALRLHEHEGFYGPAGFGAPDDWEVFSRVQKGLQTEGDEWVIMSRGAGRETADEQGRRWNRDLEEAPVRAFYRHWRQVLSA